MGILIGDTTGNLSVNASDVSQTKSRSDRQSGSNFRSDVTANGSINASDVGAVKSKSGTASEACSPLRFYDKAIETFPERERFSVSNLRRGAGGKYLVGERERWRTAIGSVPANIS